MPKIEHITAREVLDSRGNPTVEACVRVEGGHTGCAMVPSGASTGQHEALELRDGDQKRYNGLGVQKAIQNVKNGIHAALLGKDTANQTKIDHTLLELDGTANKSKLGANAVLATSLATARAEAAAQGLPLYLYLEQIFPKRTPLMPVALMNVVNGGKHASNGLSVQEFQVIPVGTSSFSETIRMGVEVYGSLKKLLLAEGYQVEVGDEGGFAPPVSSTQDVFTLLVRAMETANYVPGVDAFLGVDVAASEIYDSERDVYILDGAPLGKSELLATYRLWCEQYPLISIEDPLHQDDWKGFAQAVQQLGQSVQIVGDDFFATSTPRIQKGIAEQSANAVLIKPNQIGTLSETLRAILVAQEAKMNTIISHRSGDTEDTFIADLCIATGAGQIKTGAPARSERTAKYNRLLAIEEEIHPKMSHSLEYFLEHQRKRQAYDGVQIRV